MTKYLTGLFVAAVMMTTSSCGIHHAYEAELIHQAESIKSLPISRADLIEAFRLEGVESHVVTQESFDDLDADQRGSEMWLLDHGYCLCASTPELLRQSARSKRLTEEWMKSKPRNDFMVIEFDPPTAFDQFVIVSSKGRRVFSMGEVIELD